MGKNVELQKSNDSKYVFMVVELTEVNACFDDGKKH